jgi:hypothetical protein
MRISNDSSGPNDDNRSSFLWFGSRLDNLDFRHAFALEKQFSFAKTYFPYKICNVKQGNICGEEG